MPPPAASTIWPETLPQHHLQEGYSMSAQPAFMASEFKLKPSNTRYYNSRLSKRVALSYSMTEVQYATFKTFVADSLYNGVRWYRVEISRFSDWMLASVRIINEGDLYTATELVKGYQQVSFTAEVILDRDDTLLVDLDGDFIVDLEGNFIEMMFRLQGEITTPQDWPFGDSLAQGASWRTEAQAMITEMDDGDDLVRPRNSGTRQYARYDFALTGDNVRDFIAFSDYILTRASRPFNLGSQLVRFSDEQTPWVLTPLTHDTALLACELEELS